MSKKLLLADDSITIQKVIGITFAYEDYALTVAGDGDTAFEKALAERPDLVLADVFMPGKNGYELCAAIKKEPALKGVPVLLLTGTFEPFDQEKAAASGADSWIAKPFESQALVDRVEELLSRSQLLPQESISETVPSPPAESPQIDDIWADLSSLAPPKGESEEPAGLEEAFAPTAISEDASQPSPPEVDIWQSLGAELPADAAADPFAAAEEDRSAPLSLDPFAPETEEEPAERIDPFALAEEESVAEEGIDPFAEEPVTGAEDPFGFPEEEPESLGIDPFAAHPEEAESVREDGWGGVEPVSDRAADEAVWDTFEDEEILALEEEDIIEELEPLDEEFLAVTAVPEDDSEGEGEISQAEDDFLSAELAWEPEEAEAGEEIPPLAEMFVAGAAGDFMEAEETGGDDPFGVKSREIQEDGTEETFPTASEDSFAADYAFSLEEETPVAAAVVSSGITGEPVATSPEPAAEPPQAPASSVEEKVAALTEADIERIVEKVAGSVIERLAKTMLERIAWEVVPDLAESMIKEEIRKIREEVQ